VEEWVPEALVAPQTAFEEAEAEKLPVIVGCVSRHWDIQQLLTSADLLALSRNSPTAGPLPIWLPTTSTTSWAMIGSRNKQSKLCEHMAWDLADLLNSTVLKTYT